MATYNISLDYVPRKCQLEVHQRMEGKRFGIVIAHRRMGKSVLVRMELIHRALSRPKFEGAYIAPYLSQARRVFWGPLKETVAKIPMVEIRETEMLVVFPNGSTIRCLGADSADGIRGLGFDLCALDEYADFDPTVLPMVIMPTLAGRDGGLLVIGTVKGIDPLVELYERGLSKSDWACFKFSGEESGVLSADELRMLKDSLTDQQYRLEILCDYGVGSPTQLISGEMVNAAMDRWEHIKPEHIKDEARIMGVDIARQGDDKTVISRRQGMKLWEQDAWHSDDLMFTARRIRDAYYGFQADGLFIDGGGIGAGVVDALMDWGIPVTEVQFGGKASDPRFLNMRAEMWINFYHWLRRGGALPRCMDLKRDLTAPQHFTNDKGQTMLESKDEMRKRGMKSPDYADSAVLTMAMPVQPKSRLLESSGIATDSWQLW